MKKLFISGILFSLLGLLLSPAFGQNPNLEGTWRMDKIIIKKTTNGAESEKTYYLSQNFKSFSKCPQKVTITPEEIIFEYKDGNLDYSPYTIEDNLIKRNFSIACFKYEYLLTDNNKIQLDYSVNYTKDGIENVTEEYSLHGHRE